MNKQTHTNTHSQWQGACFEKEKKAVTGGLTVSELSEEMKE